MERRLNKIALIFIDIILINIAYLLALYIKFEGLVDTQLISYVPRYLNNAFYITIIKLGIFYYFNMYRTAWRYISRVDLYDIVTAIILSNATVLSFLFIKQENLSRIIYMLALLIDFSLIGGFRFALRDYDRRLGVDSNKKDNMKKVMIIGAGSAGIRVLKECRTKDKFDYEPLVIIDDDIKKQGEIIDEIPVVGGRQSILSAAENYHIDEIIIAIPSASKIDIRNIIDICKGTKCKLKILPTIYKSMEEYLSIESLREVEISDLLSKKEMEIHKDKITSYVTNKVVMVTVGEDSLGLEISRHIGEYKPKKLIILDIVLEDRNRIDEIINLEKPEVILHGVEHRHGSIMEIDPKGAIRDNVFASLNLAQLANSHGISKFVMISTDKATKPTNIIDASHRISEMMLQSMNRISNTEYIVERPCHILKDSDDILPFPMEYRFLLKTLDELSRLVDGGSEEDLISYVKHIVPNYKESDPIEIEAKNKYA